MIEFILNYKRFIPDGYYKTIFDVDFKTIKNQGYDTLLIDVDNTLIPYDETLPSPLLIDLFKTIRNMGFQIMIISNNHRSRIHQFSEQIACPYVASAKKPLKVGFKKALKLLNITDKQRVMVIGDQLMTDVFGSKRMGLSVILVDAIKRNNEKWFTRLNRRLEKRMLNRIKQLKSDVYHRLKLAEKR